jgi:hypothetical protein
MEIDTDRSDPTKMEEYNRYMRLHAIVKDITSGSVTRTQEWYVEHNHLLHVYDSFCSGGFTATHPLIQDPKFRENCVRLDQLMNKLMREFNLYHWFGLYDYLQFNKILIEVIDTVEEYETDDDMTSMFDNMQI